MPRRRRRVDPLDQNDRFKRDIRDTFGKVRIPKRSRDLPQPTPLANAPGVLIVRLSAPAARLLRERGLEKADVLARPAVRAAADERGVVDYAALKAILDGG